jgi:2-oxoglutarate ferredoxin oxidoreductase subunit beta
MRTKSTPFGSVENPINPIPLAIAAGATYVARGWTGHQRHLTDLIKGGIQHRGFALIDTFSPCVTFNRDNTHDYFRQRTRKLEDTDYTPDNFTRAMEAAYEWDEEIPIGLFWKRDDLAALDELEPVLEEGGPIARRPLGIGPATAESLIRELM